MSLHRRNHTPNASVTSYRTPASFGPATSNSTVASHGDVGDRDGAGVGALDWGERDGAGVGVLDCGDRVSTLPPHGTSWRQIEPVDVSEKH